MKALNQQNQASGPILVVGGTGQLGRFVVDELSSRGLGPTRCLVRNPTSESAMALAQIPGVEIVKGDLTEPEDIKAAVTGCKACICCSGPKRLSRVSDLWRDPAGDRGHPYEVNFRGVANLAAALKAAGATKIVRVTGLSVGMSPYSLVPALLNLVISRTVRWQLAGERAIRASGLDYTVIRPGALSRDASEAPEGYGLTLADDGGLPPPPPASEIRVGRRDVARLCADCLAHPNARRATLGALWSRAEGAPKTWGPLLEEVREDRTDLVDKPFLAGVRLLLLAVLGATVSGLALTSLIVSKIILAMKK